MSHRFWRVNIEVSNVCNLQCSFCPEVLRDKQFMSPQEFRHVLDQVSPFTKVVTMHLMGDPLVHPKLDELIELCAEKQVAIFLVTNGLLLREREMELLLHRSFRQINFSLHSFPDNFPGKDPKEYLARIFEFTEKALTERPRLFLNYRLWNLSHPKSREENHQTILEAIESRFNVKVPAIDTRLKKNFPIRGKLSLHFDTEFTWPSLSAPLQSTEGTCYGLSSHFGILADGKVVPCCLDKEGEIPLGNIHHTPLLDILNSPRAKAIVTGFKTGHLIEPLCQRCQYVTRFA